MRLLSPQAQLYGVTIIVKSGGKLRIIDSTGTRAGKITGGYSQYNAGVVCVDVDAEVKLDGITVSENKAAQNGGALQNHAMRSNTLADK